MLRALALALLLALSMPAAAQTSDPASLIADRVFLNGDDTITAEGAVEVIYRGVTLSATRIIYDAKGGRLKIDGPIRLSENGEVVILADAADLSGDLRDGIMTSARMVMRDQLQLAANELARIEGRYTQLTRVVASSCQVCASNPTPLWEIRASKVVHDQERQRLYFDDAQLRVMGLPVLYFPRLRLPEPGVERATGFLVPRFRTNSQLGPGIMLPYFIALGDSRDLTITPYYAVSVTRTVELRYRQAFRNGRIDLTGAISRDNIGPTRTRGYFFGTGSFRLPRDFTLRFGIEDVSDKAYLLDYDISTKDRLTSFVEVTRTRRDEKIAARATRFETIRANESNATLPTSVAGAGYVRRFDVPGIGGVGELRFGAHSHKRSSNATTDTNGDGIADGRDLARVSASLGWTGMTVLPGGLIATGQANYRLGVYTVSDDPAFASQTVRGVPTVGAELRWPLVRKAGDGSTQVLEPIAQVVWSPDTTKAVPNEDSLLVEFDEANLFSLSRFPGEDGSELGLRANLGLSWTRVDPSGWTLGVVAGRVIRERDLGQFTAASGLGGSQSDWLFAMRYQGAQGFDVMNRMLVDDDLSISQNELRLSYARSKYRLGSSFIWQGPDASQARTIATRQVTLDGAWTFAEGWHGTVGTRYDLIADRPANASLGLQFRNECAEIDLSLSRRFTSSTSVKPVTDFNLEVTLNGFGGRPRGQSYRQSCGG